MPRCPCGSWNLIETHSYNCQISGDEVKWYRCLDCGCNEIETINGVTTETDANDSVTDMQ